MFEICQFCHFSFSTLILKDWQTSWKLSLTIPHLDNFRHISIIFSGFFFFSFFFLHKSSNVLYNQHNNIFLKTTKIRTPTYYKSQKKLNSRGHWKVMGSFFNWTKCDTFFRENICFGSEFKSCLCKGDANSCYWVWLIMIRNCESKYPICKSNHNETTTSYRNSSLIVKNQIF